MTTTPFWGLYDGLQTEPTADSNESNKRSRPTMVPRNTRMGSAPRAVAPQKRSVHENTPKTVNATTKPTVIVKVQLYFLKLLHFL